MASTETIVRIDPGTGAISGRARMDEPLSDLGAASIDGTAYLVGGYTGSRFATAILRFTPPNRLDSSPAYRAASATPESRRSTARCTSPAGSRPAA